MGNKMGMMVVNRVIWLVELIEEVIRTYQEERYYSSTFVLNPPRKPLNSIREPTRSPVLPREPTPDKMDNKLYE